MLDSREQPVTPQMGTCYERPREVVLGSSDRPEPVPRVRGALVGTQAHGVSDVDIS